MLWFDLSLIGRPQRRRSSGDLLILGQDIRQRPYRRDAIRVDLLVAFGVMLLDVLELGRLWSERRHIPVELPEPLVHMRIPGSDVADVAFEVLDVHGVEADDRGEEPDIGFGDGGAVVVRAGIGGEVGFGFVEMLEEGSDSVFVGFLRAGWRSVRVAGPTGENW